VRVALLGHMWFMGTVRINVVVLSNPSLQGLNVVTSESLHLSLRASPYKAGWHVNFIFYTLMILIFHPRQSTQKIADSVTMVSSLFFHYW